jgi:capsule polysaccharide export protein KpsE/RkpR
MTAAHGDQSVASLTGRPKKRLPTSSASFQKLEAKVTLAEQRLAAKASSKDLSAQVDKLLHELIEPSAVGDLPALRTRAQAVKDALPRSRRSSSAGECGGSR